MPLFRNKALERLRSPEQLDAPSKLIRRKTSLALSATAFIILSGLIWGIFGTLPKTIEGRAILVHPGKTVTIEAGVSGSLQKWLVSERDLINDDQIIGVIEQPEVERDLINTLLTLNQQIEQIETKSNLRKEEVQQQINIINSEQSYIRSEVEGLKEHLDYTLNLINSIVDKSGKSLELQKQNLFNTRERQEALIHYLQLQHDNHDQINQQATRIPLDKTNRLIDQGRIKLNDIEIALQELELLQHNFVRAGMEARQTHSSILNKLLKREARIKNLDSKKAKLEVADHAAGLQEQDAINRLRQQRNQYQKEHASTSEIRTSHAGNILKLNVASGTQVEIGDPIATLDTATPDDKLIAVGLFPTTAARYLQPGMKARVSPTQFPRERFGSIVGTISSVSSFPVSSDVVGNLIGNHRLAAELMSGGFITKALIELETDHSSLSGFKWTSKTGPNNQVLPGTTAILWVTYRRQQPLGPLLSSLGINPDSPTE